MAEPKPGIQLAAELRQAIAEGRTREHFDVAEIACMAGCDRPCTVSFSAPNKATYLFGDISAADGVEPLLDFANQYASLTDGWSSSGDRPKALSNKTLARIPAMTGQKPAKAAATENQPVNHQGAASHAVKPAARGRKSLTPVNAKVTCDG